MNPDGHSKSLVPAHPGNLNAAKTGVFSERLLAPLVAEAEATLATQSPEETISEVLRRDLAGLIVLMQAMDASLEQQGILGRGGEPRSLIDRRLRLSDRLRHTLTQYREATQVTGVAGLGTADRPDRSSGAAAEQVDASTAMRIAADEGVQLVSLPERVALAHDASSIDAVSPRSFDAGSFLKTIIEDDRVPYSQRGRARKELTRRQPSPQNLCFCSRGNRQTETAIRESLEALREKAFGYDDDIDIALATVVSDLTGADRTVHHPDLTKKTRQILEAVLAPEPPEREPEEDSTLVPFWDVVLSPDPGIDAKRRLDAYAVLDGAGAIPRCMCPAPGWQLWEDRRDDLRAYVVWAIARDSAARWGQTAFPHAYRDVHSLLQLRSRQQPADASANDARPGQRKRRNDARGERHGTALT